MIEPKYVYYYGLLFLILVVGLGYQFINSRINSESLEEHYIGTNMTRMNDTHCVVTFLGGWDYESFVGDIRVNGKSVGHIKPYTVIHDGDCIPVKVEMYDRAVQSYLVIANYTG